MTHRAVSSTAHVDAQERGHSLSATRAPWSTDPSTAMHAHNDNVRALVCARAARASVELTSLEQSLHVTEVCVQVPPVQTIRAADTDLRMGMQRFAAARQLGGAATIPQPDGAWHDENHTARLSVEIRFAHSAVSTRRLPAVFLSGLPSLILTCCLAAGALDPRQHAVEIAITRRLCGRKTRSSHVSEFSAPPQHAGCLPAAMLMSVAPMTHRGCSRSAVWRQGNAACGRWVPRAGRTLEAGTRGAMRTGRASEARRRAQAPRRDATWIGGQPLGRGQRDLSV